MKIDITKKEYRLLLEILHMADWVMHAHENNERDDTAAYDQVMQKLMSYAKEMDCEDWINCQKVDGSYSVTFKMEQESMATQFIEEFENDSFWEELIARLSDRDVLKANKVKSLLDIDADKRFDDLHKAEEKWRQEFSTFDLDRLEIDVKESGTVH